jgi:hypothetical protein
MFANTVRNEAPVCPVCKMVCKPNDMQTSPTDKTGAYMDKMNNLWIAHVTCAYQLNLTA